MALVVGAVEPGARHRDGLAAVKGRVFAHGTGVQRSGAGDELEHTARLVQVAHCLVAPLGLLCQLQRGGALFAGKGVHGLAGALVVDHTRLVGVVGGGGGHSQYSPGVHVHYDAHCPGGNVMLLHGIIQRVFKVMLDVCVNGQPQAAALQRHPLGLVALFQRIAPCVDRRQHHAVFPGENVVVLQLQPAHTGIVHVCKAQHRGQKFPLRIPAFGILIDADAGDAVHFAESPHRVGSLPLHAVAQKAVVGGAVAELFQQFRFVQIQDFRKAFCGQSKLFFRHFPGAGPQGPAAAVGSQQDPVGAVDAATVGGDNGVPQLLAEGAVGEPPAGAELQIGQPRGQPGKAHAAQQYGHQPRPETERPFRQSAQGLQKRLWHGQHLLCSGLLYAGIRPAYD